MPTPENQSLLTTYHLPPTRRAGFSILEALLVMFVGAILAAILFPGLAAYRNKNELSSTAKQIAATLREAQSRAGARASSTTWGVHFENSTSTYPFFSLFYGTYATSTRVGYYKLPASVSYVTSTLGAGSSTEVTFSQVVGAPSASTSVSIIMRSGDSSSTISVASSGAVSY